MRSAEIFDLVGTGIQLRSESHLESSEPRYQRYRGPGWVNETRLQQNLAAHDDWQRRRRERDKCYRLGNLLLVPPWLMPQLKRELGDAIEPATRVASAAINARWFSLPPRPPMEQSLVWYFYSPPPLSRVAFTVGFDDR